MDLKNDELQYIFDPIPEREKELCIYNLLVRNHFIIVMIRWIGLAPWEFESPFPGSLTSTFLIYLRHRLQAGGGRDGMKNFKTKMSLDRKIPRFVCRW